MAKYKRTSSGYYAQRYNYLTSHGFEDWEAQEITYGGHYTSFRRSPALGKSDPAVYLQRMIKWRTLYVGNLQRKGYSARGIHQAILDLYAKKGWTSSPAGFAGVGERRDPFKMLRDFRKASIASGDYRKPPKKGSHHGLKRSDVQAQGKRRSNRGKSILQKYAEGRGRE